MYLIQNEYVKADVNRVAIWTNFILIHGPDPNWEETRADVSIYESEKVGCSRKRAWRRHGSEMTSAGVRYNAWREAHDWSIDSTCTKQRNSCDGSSIRSGCDGNSSRSDERRGGSGGWRGCRCSREFRSGGSGSLGSKGCSFVPNAGIGLKKRILTSSDKIDVIRTVPEEKLDLWVFKTFSSLGADLRLDPGGVPIMRSIAS